MESILTSIKKLIGINESDTAFDTDIIIHINTAFMSLTELKVGPSTGFIIMDNTATWTDFIRDPKKLAASKTYVYLRVKLLFDAESLTSSHVAAIERQIDKLEWLLNVSAENNTLNIDDANVSEEIKALIADLENENAELKTLASELKYANETLFKELEARVENLEQSGGTGNDLTEEQASNLAANTEARHTHSNKVEVLDKFTLDENGGLLFDGKPIEAESVGEVVSIDPRATMAQTVVLLLEQDGVTNVLDNAPDAFDANALYNLYEGLTFLYVPPTDGTIAYFDPTTDAEITLGVVAGGIYEFYIDYATYTLVRNGYTGVDVLEFFKSKLLADVNIPTKEEIVADVLDELETAEGGSY